MRNFLEISHKAQHFGERLEWEQSCGFVHEICLRLHHDCMMPKGAIHGVVKVRIRVAVYKVHGAGEPLPGVAYQRPCSEVVAENLARDSHRHMPRKAFAMD